MGHLVAGGPRNEPRQDRSRATRLRLLEAAVTCLAEQGFAASTVADVAARAGVSRGAAQHHFPTRETLFTAALEHVTAERGAILRARVGAATSRPDGAPVSTAGSGPAADRDTLAVVDVVFDLFSGELFRAALMLWVAAASSPALREQVVPLEARIGREMHRTVVDLLGVDETHAGVRETVQATLDLARGLGLANLLTDDTRLRGRIARQWARMLDTTLAKELDTR